MVIGDELERARAAREPEGDDAVVADSAPVRRRALRRVFVAAVLAWLGFLWLHQVLDGPGAPVEVGAVVALSDAAALAAGREELRGIVRTADGASASDVLVTLVCGEELFWTRTDALGTFALTGLPRGRAHFALVPLGAPGLELDVELPAAGPLEHALPPPYPATPVLREMRGRTLEGRAELPFERDAVGYTVVAVPYDVGPNGGAPVVAPGLDGRVERRVAIDRSGWFRFDELALGGYELRLLPPWARVADWPVLGSLVYEHDGRGGVPIAMGTCGALEILVLDGERMPIDGALVTIQSAADASLLLPSATTGADGRLVVEDVPTGSLRVRARAGRFASERTVRIDPGERESFTLDLVLPAASLDARAATPP